jgi:hypothetical protein
MEDQSTPSPPSSPLLENVVPLVLEPVAELVLEPVAELVLEPVAELVLEPVAELVLEPVAELVLEPVAELVLEPVAELVLEPVAELVLEPVAELVLEPAVELVLEPVAELVLEPVVVAAPVSDAVVAAPVPVKALIKLDAIDVLYNKMILNSSLLATINDLKINGFTNASIPLLILSSMTTYNSYTSATPAHTLGTDDIQVLLERVYNYFVEKYDLIDVPNRLAMYNLFDASLKLCLAMPNVKKEITSCLKFFRCAK